MGKLNYLLMLLRIRLLFFVRNRIFKITSLYCHRRPQPGIFNRVKKNNLGKLTGMPGEYRIHIDEEQITHYLN
jgi:hypothetical protein